MHFKSCKEDSDSKGAQQDTQAAWFLLPSLPFCYTFKVLHGRAFLQTHATGSRDSLGQMIKAVTGRQVKDNPKRILCVLGITSH